MVEISDDGRGIDVQKVKTRALQQGLWSEQESGTLDEATALNLIFRPGFSTADEITEISGRGVGLDVVQSILQRLKGTIQIETRPGQGTTFRLCLPLTLAIIKALLFRVEQRLYAIPLNAVAEIARVQESDLHQVDNREVLQLRNRALPVVRLGNRTTEISEHHPDDRRHGKIFVLVTNLGERKLGLLVNGLEGEEELVIKALDDRTVESDLVSGASILGDGRVVLILNLAAIVERFAKSRPGTGTDLRWDCCCLTPNARELTQASCGRAAMSAPVRVLVVDDSALMRKLIPQILATDRSIQVVGTAMDGNFGLKKIEELKPQVVTLDLEMPGMGGLDMLKEIMRGHRAASDRGQLSQRQRSVGDAQGAVHGSL